MLQEIFDRLCDLDEKGMSYIFEAARNPTRLYDQMAKLLAHPLQRPLQSEIAYRLHNIADLTDTWYLSSVQCKAVTCHEILTSEYQTDRPHCLDILTARRVDSLDIVIDGGLMFYVVHVDPSLFWCYMFFIGEWFFFFLFFKPSFLFTNLNLYSYSK